MYIRWNSNCSRWRSWRGVWNSYSRVIWLYYSRWWSFHRINKEKSIYKKWLDNAIVEAHTNSKQGKSNTARVHTRKRWEKDKENIISKASMIVLMQRPTPVNSMCEKC